MQVNLSTKKTQPTGIENRIVATKGGGQGERWAKHFVLVDAALIFRMNKNGPTV